MIKFTARKWDEERLAIRLARMLVGNDQVWYQADSRKWQLGSGNNFWLHPEGHGRYTLSLRYSSQEKIDALAVLLEWRLQDVCVEKEKTT